MNLVCLVRHLLQQLFLGLLMFLVTLWPLLRPTETLSCRAMAADPRPHPTVRMAADPTHLALH